MGVWSPLVLGVDGVGGYILVWVDTSWCGWIHPGVGGYTYAITSGMHALHIVNKEEKCCFYDLVNNSLSFAVVFMVYMSGQLYVWTGNVRHVISPHTHRACCYIQQRIQKHKYHA